MTVMDSKWRGKCKVCGVVILPGTPIDWTAETGARHVTDEACLAALANPPVLPVAQPLRGPRPQRPEDLERMRDLFDARSWKFARTLARIPHWYSLRKDWPDDADFVWAVEEIRRVGYQKRFGSMVFLYHDVGAHTYWECCSCGLDESRWDDLMTPHKTRPGEFAAGLINRTLLDKAALKAIRDGRGREPQLALGL